MSPQQILTTVMSFARGLHADVSLFICTFSRRFSFIDVTDTLHKMKKKITILPEMRNVVPVNYKLSDFRV